MEEMTITRALAELKLLDDRISKKIQESAFTFLYSKKIRMTQSPETLANQVQSNYQSINDLMNRRKKIKSLVILSNAFTKVKLGDEELTVAEVIERKAMIKGHQDLLSKLKRDRENILSQVERNNQIMENDLQKILEVNFGKQSNIKTNSDDIDNISKAYRETNRSEMIDPIKIDQKISELEDYIQRYTTESNFILSESNAITKIKI